MKRYGLIIYAVIIVVGIGMGDANYSAAKYSSKKKGELVQIEREKNAISILFGPIDLPTSHHMELAASIPPYQFQLDRDRYLIGFETEVFTEEGKALPNHYLHHMLLLNTDQESPACPGEPLFVGGTGMEMVKVDFPSGYGVQLKNNDRLMAVIAFYHKVPPTKNVYARFTMRFAPQGQDIKNLNVYQIGVNVVCYSKFNQRKENETDEGIKLNEGMNIYSEPVAFRASGCVKFAYPHGHDGLILLVLDNTTKDLTLLRTMPSTDIHGRLKGFDSRQVYHDSKGFMINKSENYKLTMVYHIPTYYSGESYGMGNYLLYYSDLKCP